MQTIGESIIFYNQELALAQKLLWITELIRDLLQKEKFEQVFKKLKKRTEIISRLKFFEQSIIGQQKIRKVASPSIVPQEEACLQTLLQGIKEIFERVQNLDQEIKAQILQEKEKVSMQLKKVSTDHKLINRYFPKREGNNPRFFSLSL
jgi:hypothetical protein